MAGTVGLKPHERLLVACLRNDQEVGSFLAESLDWPAAVRTAVRHGVAPSVARKLAAFFRDGRVPREIAQTFESLYDGNRDRNHIYFEAAGALIDVLESAGIQCLLLKGVALASSVYDDPSLRTFADIDVLVDPSNYQAAIAAAEAAGYTTAYVEPEGLHHELIRIHPEDLVSRTVAPQYDPTIPPARIARHKHNIRLEIHRGLFRDDTGWRRDVDLIPVFDGAVSGRFPDGRSFGMPRPEHMLIHLSAHARSHGFNRLTFLVDVARLLRVCEERLDWEMTYAEAVRCGALADVGWMLMLTRNVLGVEAPAMVMKRFASTTVIAELAGYPRSAGEVFAAMEKGPAATVLTRARRAGGTGAAVAAVGRRLAPGSAFIRRRYGVRHPLAVAAIAILRPFLLLGSAVGYLVNQLANPRRRALA
jgi:hypothetical protein